MLLQKGPWLLKWMTNFFNRLLPPGSHSPWLVRQKIHKNKALALKRSFQLRVSSTSEASTGVTFKWRKGGKAAVAFAPGRTTHECALVAACPTHIFFLGNSQMQRLKVAWGGGGGGAQRTWVSKSLDSLSYHDEFRVTSRSLSLHQAPLTARMCKDHAIFPGPGTGYVLLQFEHVATSIPLSIIWVPFSSSLPGSSSSLTSILFTF